MNTHHDIEVKGLPGADAPIADFIFPDADFRSCALAWARAVAADVKEYSDDIAMRAGKILLANSPSERQLGEWMATHFARGSHALV